MPLWNIKAYHLAGGTCPIQDWYRVQDIEVKAEFDAAIGVLSATENWMDEPNLFKELTRTHAGLGEIRFMLRKPTIRRFRPVGIWPPITENEFILLLGCEKRMGIYIPPDAFTQALIHRREFEMGRGEIHDYV